MGCIKKILFRMKGGGAANTFIGGVASVINTPSLLADKLRNYPSGTAFSATDIQNFTIVGDDIECYIGVDYMLGENFLTDFTTLTYYRDVGGKAISNNTGSQSKMFLRCYNLEDVFFPNMINIKGVLANWTFENTYGSYSKWKIFYIPNVINFGSTTSNDGNVFRTNFSNSIKIYAHSSMQTINAGGVEGDLALFDSLGSNSVNYVLNLTPPAPITDLTIGTITSTTLQLNFTVPSSTNAIDFYEVWLNGKRTGKTVNASGENITGLTTGTSYEIEVIPRDIYYNGSSSNKVTQSTI